MVLLVRCKILVNFVIIIWIIFLGNIKIDNLIPCILNENTNRLNSSNKSIETIFVENENEKKQQSKLVISAANEKQKKKVLSKDDQTRFEENEVDNIDKTETANQLTQANDEAVINTKSTAAAPQHVNTNQTTGSTSIFQSSFSSSANLKLVWRLII